jgi:hypothetical protein
MYLSMIRMMFGVNKRILRDVGIPEGMDLFNYWTDDVAHCAMELLGVDPGQLFKLTLARRLQKK